MTLGEKRPVARPGRNNNTYICDLFGKARPGTCHGDERAARRKNAAELRGQNEISNFGALWNHVKVGRDKQL